MNKIRLKNTNKYTIVDDEDFDRLSVYTWRIHDVNSKRPYVVRGRNNVRMHREIMRAKKNFDVDHINFNTLDNRKQNLRVCSRRNNCRYSRTLKKTISNYKGVIFENGNRVKPRRARIFFKGKNIHIGCFEKKRDAAIAYNKAAKRYYKKFASLNLITE